MPCTALENWGPGDLPLYFCSKIIRYTEHCGLSRRNRLYKKEEEENCRPISQAPWSLFQKDFCFGGGVGRRMMCFIFEILDLILPVWSYHFHSLWAEPKNSLIISIIFIYHQKQCSYSTVHCHCLICPVLTLISKSLLEYSELIAQSLTGRPGHLLIQRIIIINSEFLINDQGKGRSYWSGGVISCSSLLFVLHGTISVNILLTIEMLKNLKFHWHFGGSVTSVPHSKKGTPYWGPLSKWSPQYLKVRKISKKLNIYFNVYPT